LDKEQIEYRNAGSPCYSQISAGTDFHSSCNFCGSGGDSIWSDGRYEALKCKNCGVIWVSPQPDFQDLSHLYSRDYFEKYYLKYEKERKDYFRQRLEEIEQIICSIKSSTASMLMDTHSPQLLDIGCGVGFFLEVAREKGWMVEGIEISQFALEYCRNRGFSVYPAEYMQILSAGMFDLITMWDVLAHLTSPGEYLKKIRVLLREGGLFVIKTPDHPSRLFKIAGIASLFGPAKGLLHIPAQIYHFEPENLKKNLEKFGFKVIAIKRIREAIKGGWTPSKFKNFLIKSFNIFTKSIGIGESFIIYALK